MKKLIAIMLMVLMVVPFGAISTSAAVDLPAEPTLTNTETMYYIGNSGKGTKDGSSAANYLPTAGWDPVNYPQASGVYQMHDAMKNGGTFVIAGKGYVGASPAVVAATASPVLFTAFDGTTDLTGTIDNTTDANGNGKPDGQGTQTGMFMVKSQGTVIFMGDVIFDKVTIIDRTNGAKAAEGTPKTTTIGVGSTGKMVIGADTVITGSHNDKEDSLYNPILDVAEGGYAFLHAVGFSKYTGTGTIVLCDEIIDDVTPEMFADFEGTIVDKNGNDPFAPVQPPVDTEPTEPDTTEPTEPETTEPADTTEPQDTAPATTEPAEDTEQPGNGPTGDASFLLAVIAAASVMAVVAVMIIKKKELN